MEIPRYALIPFGALLLTFLVLGSFAHAQAPGGGAPGGTGATLGKLDCSESQIARLIGAAWVCDSGLTTLESQNLDARLTTLEGQSLDGRVTNLEDQTTLTELSCLDGQIPRIVASGSGLTWSCTDALGALLSFRDLADDRLASLEDEVTALDTRVTDLEERTTLTSLLCPAGEILRTNVTADGLEWNCTNVLDGLANGIDNNDDRITTLQGDVATLEFLVDTLEASTTAALAAALDAQDRVGVLESQNLDSRLTSLEDGQPARTIFVPADGASASDNGAALADAVTEAQGRSPTAANPVLIVLDPGTYNIGNAVLSLPDFVSLQGSGERATEVTGSSDTAVIVLSDRAMLRDVGVSSTGTFAEAVRINGTDVLLRNLHISRTPSNALNIGIHVRAGSSVTLDHAFIRGFTQSIRVTDATAAVSHVDAEDRDAAGGLIARQGAEVTVIDSRLQPLNDNSGTGLSARGSGTTIEAQDSLLGSVSINENASATIEDSRMRTLRSSSATPGTADVAGSQILFPSGASSLAPRCVFSYDANYQPLDASCL